jgi:hypothetical protein
VREQAVVAIIFHGNARVGEVSLGRDSHNIDGNSRPIRDNSYKKTAFVEKKCIFAPVTHKRKDAT